MIAVAGRAQGGVVAMATLTNFLPGAVDRFVVDRTRLDGRRWG
jgi:hypothetical protein